MNVRVIDWTGRHIAHALFMHACPNSWIIWMNAIQYPLLIEVKWDCVIESPWAQIARTHVLMHLHLSVFFFSFSRTHFVRNINLCNVFILINFCWRCRKVTWMDRVYGHFHRALFQFGSSIVWWSLCDNITIHSTMHFIVNSKDQMTQNSTKML